MKKYLVLTIRFLGDRYHGRTENGREREWPPSPLRLFQAIVAGATSRWYDQTIQDREIAALEWFEGLEPPQIVAPVVHPGKPLLKYVRENLSDVPSEKRDAKFSRPTLFVGEPVVLYYWPIDPDHEDNAKTIARCSRRCRALGWGIDMVIGNGNVAETEPSCTTGEKWLPMTHLDGCVQLRMPRHSLSLRHRGTLTELRDRFSQSLNRIATDGRNPVPPLSAFHVVGYRRATDFGQRPFAAFSVLRTDASGFLAFDTVRRVRTVAGMVRCVASSAAKDTGWPEEKINAFILGHGESRSDTGHAPVEGSRRFAYLPVPSIESRGPGRPSVVGNIRRVLVTTFADGCESEIAWARRALSNQALIDEDSKEQVALLSLLAQTDRGVRNYTQRSSCWATVTPVVLPGYDDPDHLRRRATSDKLSTEQQRRILDRLSNRIEGLLRKAITQAGFPAELAEHAALDWRGVGFWPGTDLASRYNVPDYLKPFPKLHVRIEWRDASGRAVHIPGPICIGGGRYFGLGLFAAVPE